MANNKKEDENIIQHALVKGEYRVADKDEINELFEKGFLISQKQYELLVGITIITIGFSCFMFLMLIPAMIFHLHGNMLWFWVFATISFLGIPFIIFAIAFYAFYSFPKIQSRRLLRKQCPEYFTDGNGGNK